MCIYINHVYKLYIYIYTLPLVPLCPSHPTPLACHTVPTGLPVLYGSFPLAIFFTHGNVYMSLLLSQFIPPSPSSSVSTSPSFMSPSPFLPGKWFISTTFLDSIYIHSYIFVFLFLTFHSI